MGSDDTDDTMDCYLVGSYVYGIYKGETGGIDITGDPDVFYLTLGTIIRDYYPEPFRHIIYLQAIR